MWEDRPESKEDAVQDTAPVEEPYEETEVDLSEAEDTLDQLVREDEQAASGNKTDYYLGENAR